MSGALTRTSAPFQQQGSVDWVELSSRSVQFSIAVLARLSRAGIDPFTLQVGRAICANFSLQPIAQERITDAILALKKYGSYGDVIWFGFGVKHVVTDLAETEEGLTLVALCAALSTTYDSLYGARVLRELCGLCKAPQSFSPAIRQWKTLIELCAGILTSGHFALILEGFRRLVSAGRSAPRLDDPTTYSAFAGASASGLEGLRSPTSYSALAEAILMIAQVTDKKLASATLTGGLDCVWLAAVAEWVFSLDIIVYGSAGVPLHRSRSLDQRPPQIIVVYATGNDIWEEQSLVSEKTSLISSGRTLFVHEDQQSLGDRHFFNWRSSWSTILHDTFHKRLDSLLIGENAYTFGLYLYCVSMLQEPDLRFKSQSNSPSLLAYVFANNIIDPLIWTQENSRGHKFLSFASRRLPELSHCLQYDFSSISQETVLTNVLAARDSLGRSGKLADVIIIFLWMTLVSDIDDGIMPSVIGLRNLYRWLDPVSPRTQILSYECKEAQQTALLFHVLSGVFVDVEDQVSTQLPSRHLAMAGAGLCIYRQALVDPNLPPDSLFRYRVLSGYISHAGAVFKRIKNLSCMGMDSKRLFSTSSVLQSVDALVQETDRDSELAMAYQVNYTNRVGKMRYHFLSIGRLLRKLQNTVTMLKCEGGCSDLLVKSQRGVDRPDESREISSWRASRRYPAVVFDEAAAITAQRYIKALHGSSNLWVLTSIRSSRMKITGSRFSSYHVDLQVARPLVIYLLTNNDGNCALCMFPSIPCLDCIVERGCLAKIYQDLAETMPSTGLLRLAAPEKPDVEMIWETLEPIAFESSRSLLSQEEAQPVMDVRQSVPNAVCGNNETTTEDDEPSHSMPTESHHECSVVRDKPNVGHSVIAKRKDKSDVHPPKENTRQAKSWSTLASFFRTSGGSSSKKT